MVVLGRNTVEVKMAEKFGEKKDKSAAEMRKINKPLMERKRRERINNCLNQLKMFLMETTKKDSSYYSKLEKADILELTVKYLKTLQRQQIAAAMVTDPKLASKYTAGYSQCADEVTRYLNKLDGFNPDLRGRLLGHLTNCLQTVESSTSSLHSQGHSPGTSQGHHHHHDSLLSLGLSSSATASHTQARPDSPDLATTSVALSTTSSLPTVTFPSSSSTTAAAFSLNINQQAQQLQQQFLQQQQQQNVPVLPVQLIPAKLPSGDMVFLMANTQSVPTMTTNLVTAPVSIQIPGASPSTASVGVSPCLSVGGASVGIPSNSTGSTTATSVAVVQPNVHESEPSPCMPTDLSMKSDIKDIKISPKIPAISPPSAPLLSLATPPSASIHSFPSLPLNLQTHSKNRDISVKPDSPQPGPSWCGPFTDSKTKVTATVTRSQAGDENNNSQGPLALVQDSRDRSSPPGLLRRDSPVLGPVFPGPAPPAPVVGPPGLFLDPNQAGPGGFGPMWRPW